MNDKDSLYNIFLRFINMKLHSFSVILLAVFFASCLCEGINHAAARNESQLAELNADVTKSFGEICSQNGFAFQMHQVVTQDGYVLSVFRIPGTLNQHAANGKVALLQHGILDSADAFIMHYADKAPAFQLVRAGYDVWLSNSRGNKYSHSNTHLSPLWDAKDFFDFSFSEMGRFDLAYSEAVIEYIRSETGVSKIAYVAHSQGTTEMIYDLSKDSAWFKERLSAVAFLGPVATLKHCSSGILNIMSTLPALI